MLLIRSIVLAAALLASAPLLAAPADASSIAEIGERLLRERAQPQADVLGADIAVRVPTLAARAADAPCKPEVFLPPTAKPWGKTQIGLRCADSNWTVRLPAEVALTATVPTPTRPIKAGAVLAPGDWTMTELNVAGWTRGVTVDETGLAGSRVTRPLRAGEPIPPDALTSAARMGVGEQVRVLLIGKGFTVRAAGEIVQQSTVGGSARVKLESGRTVSGTLRPDKQIEVQL
jgi:flagella basal body P-ring formation protein FlgA